MNRRFSNWAKMVAFVPFVALVGGCPKPIEEELQLEIGSGLDRFEVIEDGASLPLVAGVQGGYHVWLSYRIRGASGDFVLLDLDLMTRDGTPDPEDAPPVRRRLDSVSAEIVGTEGRIFDAGCYVDRPLQANVTVTDRDGRQASATLDFVPVFDGEIPCER